MRQSRLHTIFLLLIISGLMLFLVLAGCMERQPVPDIKRGNKPTPLPQIKPQQSDEEYDFMASQEAVPARFNLAEAYMQMREYAQAKRVLEGILHQGDPDQRQKASALLSQLPSS